MTECFLNTACCGGTQQVYRHQSPSVRCLMECAVFLPAEAEQGPVRAVIYLSGLTCTWENAVTKAGAQAHANALGMAVIFPDTSPRGEAVPNDDAYDLGQGAGFYLNATQAPWNSHFFMENYVVSDIRALIEEAGLPIKSDYFALMGHSMGGHGALTLAMKNPDLFRSVSAFAPIVNPAGVPWGKKAFTAYLGDDEASWDAYDACALMRERGYHGEILVDQGRADAFLEQELKPERFAEACTEKGVSLRLRQHEGYDHSYYFMMSFMAEHLQFHHRQLERLKDA